MFMSVSPSSYLDYVGIIKCVAIGALLTAIVQSSSATLGITIALAMTGSISYPAAAALVLGENIGTTITAYLASLGASTNAKRASYAHMMINVIGVIWIVSIFWLYIPQVEKFVGLDQIAADRAVAHGDPNEFGFVMWDKPDENAMSKEEYTAADKQYKHASATITAAIATTHTGFNIANMLIFLPFVGLLAKLLEKIVPDKARKERPHLTFLDVRMLDTPSIGIEQSEKEIVRMAEMTRGMLGALRGNLVAEHADRDKAQKLFEHESILDVMQKEIMEFLSGLLAGNISHNVITNGRNQLRMADEYESIGDYVTTILKLRLKMDDTGERFSDTGRREILELHDMVAEYIAMINRAVDAEDSDIFIKADVKGNDITRVMKDFRTSHLERVGTGTTTPLKSLIFTDMLNSYRRIKDHAFNIAEVLAGEK
jgi:phosphate:Na+ symporter